MSQTEPPSTVLDGVMEGVGVRGPPETRGKGLEDERLEKIGEMRRGGKSIKGISFIL